MPKPRPEGDAIRPEYVKPFVDEGLGNSSYLVVSEPEKATAVVHPERDPDGSIERAHSLGALIGVGLEPPLHADLRPAARGLPTQTRATMPANRSHELGL